MLTMFQPVESSVSFPKLEEEIARFWKEREIYEKSLAARADGPGRSSSTKARRRPTACPIRATASPGPSRTSFPATRRCGATSAERKAGWDTHGLPVEVEVCKELGIHSKEEIEAFGVEPFIRKCVESVFRYTQQWEQLTERLGFWIHLDEAYVTFHQSYVESVWWALKTLFDRGLLYQGHKIVWWWAQGGTALSSGEVGQGYREVADPSVYVRFPLVEERAERRGERDQAVTPLAASQELLQQRRPARLDHHPVDAAQQPVRRREARPGILGRLGRRRVAKADSRLGAWSKRSSPRSARNSPSKRRCPASNSIGLRYLPPFRSITRTKGGSLNERRLAEQTEMGSSSQ